MNKHIKILLIMFNILLLFLVGCGSKKMEEKYEKSKMYSMYLKNIDEDTIKQIEQYGEIIKIEEENYFVTFYIFGEENEREKKREAIKKFESVKMIEPSEYFMIKTD